MKVVREEFLRALKSIEPGLAAKEILEQSKCYIFKDGRVSVYNDEVSCTVPSGLDKSFHGAVHAKPLTDVLEKLKDDEIEITLGDGEFLLSAKGNRKQLGIRMEKDILLPIDSIEKPTEWKDLHPDFCEAVGTVHLCAGEDEARFDLVCVNIHPKWIETCDGFQLCRWKLKTPISKPVLVRSSSVKHLEHLGMTQFCEGDSWLHFKNPHNLVFSIRRYLEDFPDLTEMLEVEGIPATLPKGLTEASEIANVFSSEQGEVNHVRVVMKPGKIKVRGQGVTGWYQETRKVKYDGPPIEFLISPKILGDLVKKHSTVVITQERLKVEAGNYTFVSCLAVPDDKVEAKEEVEMEEVGASEE